MSRWQRGKEIKMKVSRKVIMKVDNFEIGDQITVKVKGYGKFTATAQRIEAGATLFFFDNCITSRPMNAVDSNEDGFFASDLCEWMNTELIEKFPQKIRKRMLRVAAGEDVMLRLPKRCEMFGQDDASDNYASGFADEYKEQLPLMKDRKNRVCSSPTDEYCWYWLMDKHAAYGTGFAGVNSNGNANNYGASDTRGVRPAFIIKNL